MKPLIRHIPAGDRTYCGRFIGDVALISLRTDSIEDAECKSCQRVDDARQLRSHREAEAVMLRRPDYRRSR